MLAAGVPILGVGEEIEGVGQWLTSGTVPDRYPVFFTCPTTRSIKIVCPTGIEFSKSSDHKEEEVLQEDSTESDSDEFDM